MSLKKYRPNLAIATTHTGNPLTKIEIVVFYLSHEWGINPHTFDEEYKTKTFKKIRQLLNVKMTPVSVVETLLKWFWSEGMPRCQL